MVTSIIPAIGDRCKVINWWPALALTCSVAAARLWCMSIGVVELDGYPCWRTTLVSACHLPYCSNWRWDYCSWCTFIRDYCTGKTLPGFLLLGLMCFFFDQGHLKHKLSWLQAEIEVARLDTLKASRMKELVVKRRMELEDICRCAHVEPDASTTEEKLIAMVDSGE